MASYQALELRRQLEELPEFDVLGSGVFESFSVRALKCPKTLLSCPAVGCTTDSDRKQFNRAKRFFPKTTVPPKRLTFDLLRKLQAATNARGVPQGSPPNGDERKRLKNIEIENETYSQGDYVELIGYVASDRDVTCGGIESVNCKLSNSGIQVGPCDKTDIHVPLVEIDTHDQWKSVVAEPIAQGRPGTNGTVLVVRVSAYGRPPFLTV